MKLKQKLFTLPRREHYNKHRFRCFIIGVVQTFLNGLDLDINPIFVNCT